MTLPIIFIHKGNSDYLLYTLLQAKLANPHSDVILIGDVNNNCYPFVKHYFIDDYFEGAKEFEKVYKHLSINNLQYELFCFQRWFVLEDFISRWNLTCFYYQDSDIMLYTDMTQYQKKFNDYSVICAPDSAHCTFFKKFYILDGFCKFILRHYQNNELFMELEIKYKEWLKEDPSTASISDMVLFQSFLLENNIRYKSNLEVTDDSVFDYIINFDQGFETLQGLKKVYLQNGYLFCKDVTSNRFIKLNSLHFQGWTKPYIKYFIQSKYEKSKVVKFFDYKSCKWVNTD